MHDHNGDNFCSFRVEFYIRYGWDYFLVDPDKGLNVQKKLTNVAAQQPGSILHKIFQSLPKSEDPLWTKQLVQLPRVTFSTIYEFLVDRKVVLPKVSYLESIADIRAEKSMQNDMEDSGVLEENSGIMTEYTRTLEKAYRFFQDGHIQDVKFHPMTNLEDFICITAKVLPSMRKDRVYAVTIVMQESTCSVTTACCTCTAGLSGCCNHVTGTLYCLEDYIHQGLQDDERKGCTERLQKWNRPRKQDADARPTDEVTLTKKVYGVEKRAKLHSINEWDCRPISKRIIDPNKARRFMERLQTIQQQKIDAANNAISTAATISEIKKAFQVKAMLSRYGTSGYLQLLDNEPAPLESREEKLRKERLTRAAEKKQQFLEQLKIRQLNVMLDHNYTSETVSREVNLKIPDSENQLLLKELYTNHVCMDHAAIVALELQTRAQSDSPLWHHERTLRITSSIMKEVCHRKDSTSSFVSKKLAQKPVDVIATRYGKQHEKSAIASYLNYHKARGVMVNVHPCGLYVDVSIPWLAASPDGVVLDPTQYADKERGCLEVKCPILCEKSLMLDISRKNASFCLKEKNGEMELSSAHSYYYQIQTEMHVTRLLWCDFVVWSPIENPFVQRVHYNKAFMEMAISRAKMFYFEKYLPSVVSCMIITPTKSKGISVAEPCIPLSSDKPSIADSSVKSPTTVSSIIAVSSSSVKPSTTFSSVKPSISVKPSTTFSSVKSSISVKPTTTFSSVKSSISVKPTITLSSVKPMTTFSSVKPSTTVLSVKSSNTVSLVKPTTAISLVEPSTTIKLSSTVVPTQCSLSPDLSLQFVSTQKTNLLSVNTVLKQLNVIRHSIDGDGSCLYHAVAHQAGLIPKSSRGDKVTSNLLRQIVRKMMDECPHVRIEDGLSLIQWLKRKQTVLDPSQWGGDLELRLLAIGLKRDIVVITSVDSGESSYARRFPCEPKPSQKMRGGIFIPLSCNEFCSWWQCTVPSPLLLIFNGYNHYDSTSSLSAK